MTSLSEQLSAAPNNYLTAPMNAQLTVLNALATQAIDSASRITALNLTTSQEVLERSAQTARQLIGARDARDLAVLRSHAEEQVHSLFAYSRELLGIAVGAQPFLVRSATPAPVAAPVAEMAPVADMAQAVVDAGKATADTIQAAAGARSMRLQRRQRQNPSLSLRRLLPKRPSRKSTQRHRQNQRPSLPRPSTP
jgi:phasin family protein